MNQIIKWRSKPLAIRVDSGPEYFSARLQNWAGKAEVGLVGIQQGEPEQNTYVEFFNKTVRIEWLGRYYFDSTKEVQNHTIR